MAGLLLLFCLTLWTSSMLADVYQVCVRVITSGVKNGVLLCGNSAHACELAITDHAVCKIGLATEVPCAG
jgi:hypothetical protein